MECFNVSSVVRTAMKILIISSTAHSLINFRGELIKSLQAKNLMVHVAIPKIDVDVESRTTLESMGCTIHGITLVRAGMNPLSDVLTLLSTLKLMINIRPQYVLAYTIKPVIYGMLAARVMRIKNRFALITGLGYTFQESSKSKVLQKFILFLYKLALAGTGKVIFQNPDDQALFKKLDLIKNQVNFVVNGSGVDLSHFAQQPLPQEPPKFLMIARLLKDKGVQEYMQAAKLVRMRHSKVVFQLAGWLDQNPSAITQQELDECVNSGDIEYLGKLSDVRPALAKCSVFVLPSYREGTPRSVLEAMAIGRPVITTDAPGCRETVENGVNGFLIPIKDSESLANAMLKFINNTSMISVMAKESLSIVAEKYDVRKVNKQMLIAMGLE
jgi:glycosyltransferase involved in cell wall biosynthesis